MKDLAEQTGTEKRPAAAVGTGDGRGASGFGSGGDNAAEIVAGTRSDARDARVGRFSQVWVVRSDRLGRDAFELLRIWRVFESIGVALRATDENIDDPFYFDIHAVIAANERRKFLERSAEGMNRAAKEGRYTGGIVPLGYTASGDRGARRLVPDDSLMWEDLSAADVVRRIYDHLAIDGWTCPRIADEFNSLGIPTSYRRDGRGVRGRRTQGLWRSGHIRNLVVNPVYRGVLQYGRRSSRPMDALSSLLRFPTGFR